MLSLSTSKVHFVLLLGFVFFNIFSPASVTADTNSDLIDAVKKGDIKKVETIVNSADLVNIRNNDDFKTPLLLLAIEEKKPAICKLLIEKGADVNDKTLNASSALMYASWSGDKEIAELLMAKGANINSRNNEGWTAVMIAAYKDNKEIVELLTQKGADLSFKEKNGRSALMIASNQNNREIQKILLQAGANRKDLIVAKRREWWYCDDNNNCIDKMRITFENKSFENVSAITFFLTIKDKNDDVLYKKKHTVIINIEPEETAPCNEFDLSTKVFCKDFVNTKNINTEVDIISVK